MAQQRVSSLDRPTRAGPIDRIAEADRNRVDAVRPEGANEFDAPELQPPSRPLAPQGLAGAVDRALGRVELPTLLELANALDEASEALAQDDRIEPAMRELLSAVLTDEQRKVMRYLDVRDK